VLGVRDDLHRRPDLAAAERHPGREEGEEGSSQERLHRRAQL
jgi:hypothetical protein